MKYKIDLEKLLQVWDNSDWSDTNFEDTKIRATLAIAERLERIAELLENKDKTSEDDPH